MANPVHVYLAGSGGNPNPTSSGPSNSGNNALSISVPCRDTSEAVELLKSCGLYLKPIAKINITVQLPVMRQAGKTISNWEVMEKIRSMIRPEEFLHFKIVKSTLEFIRFEGELEARSLLGKVKLKLDNQIIKLTGFVDSLKVRAAEAKIPFPTRHDWDSFFRDAKDMNEMRAGERPDTVHIQGLPSKWFTEKKTKDKSDKTTEDSCTAPSSGELKPSDTILRKVFAVFGDVRCLDIPILDAAQAANTERAHTFSFGSDLLFEAFVQYKEYISFVKAMDALRGMKLMYYDVAKTEAFTANIKVDFDRTKHLSEKSIRKRRLATEKFELEKRKIYEQAEEEKRQRELEDLEKEKARIMEAQMNEERRLMREAKRKDRAENRRRKQEEKQMQFKIDMEERKILIAMRKLETIRLLSELLRRVKIRREREEVERREIELQEERKKQLELDKIRKEERDKKKLEAEKRKKAILAHQEKELRDKILKNMKLQEERKSMEEREALRKRLLAGKVKLKSSIVKPS